MLVVPSIFQKESRGSPGDQYSLTSVNPLMLIHMTLLGEPLRAEIALVRPLIAVDAHVLLQTTASLQET